MKPKIRKTISFCVKCNSYRMHDVVKFRFGKKYLVCRACQNTKAY